MAFGIFKNKEKELAKSRRNLIHDLENKGVKNLILMMDCHEPYCELIKEKQEKQGSFSSEDAISSYAYKVAGSLDKPVHKQELMALLGDSDFDKYKKYIYSCLASLCSNTSDYHLFRLLLNEIGRGKNEDIVVSILSRLENMVKPFDTDIEIIKEMAKEGTKNVRLAAIKALSNSHDKEVENLLLEEFKVSDTDTKGIICVPLRSVGTAKSIPQLEKAFKITRSPFLKWQIEDALTEINLREQSGSPQKQY